MSEKITGSEALCRALIAEGVDTLFGYPGGQIMPMISSTTSRMSFIISSRVTNRVPSTPHRAMPALLAESVW